MSRVRSSLARAAALAVRGTIGTVAVLIAGAFVWSALQMPGAKASRKADDDPPKAADAATPATNSRIVQLNRDGQEKGGIETLLPTPAPFQTRVRAYGTVLVLDKLTTLYNASLTDTAQLRIAETRESASRTAKERAQNLLKVFSTAKAQAEAAEAAYDIDSAGVDAAKAQIDALRNTAIQDWGPVLGPAIVARAPLAQRLVLRQTCLIQLSLQPGATAAPPRRISVALGAGTPLEGTFVSEATQADPKIQNIGFLYSVPVSSGLLPGASVLAYLTEGDVKPGVGIPSSAVVWQAGKAWMYLRTGADTFERRPLDETAAPTFDGGYVVPAKSVPHDTPLVVAGAQILLSQESRAQIPSDEDDN